MVRARKLFYYMAEEQRYPLIAIFIAFGISEFCNNEIKIYSKMNGGEFLHNLSLGILAWSSIQAAALLAIYLHFDSDIKFVKNNIEKIRTRRKTLKELIYMSSDFELYFESIFWGWIVSCAVSLIALLLTVMNPDITDSSWAYHIGSLMFSLFFGLLVFLYRCLKKYRSFSE